MAYTRIHAIKATVNKSIAYITNPAKTDGEIYVSSYGCSPKTAHLEFTHLSGKKEAIEDIKAYHLIQSFAPGEVSFEEAHKIGTELADKVLEGKYSYVIATHIEKNHIHNHIIFSATNNTDHHKYNDCKRSYHRIRQLSDELCTEHNISVIKPSPAKGKKYTEWQMEKEGTSWKAQLKTDIDECIKFSRNYESFLELMRAKGYEIKGELLSPDAPKYIAFKPAGAERFVRGSERTLGSKYTKEEISRRVESNAKRKVSFPKRPTASTPLIDTTEEKFTQSPGLRRWANVQNLKAMASSYAAAGSIAELKASIEQKREVAKTAKASLVSIESDMKELGEIIKYAEIYKQNKRFHDAYKKSKDPDAYLRDRRNDHEAKLIIYDSAVRFLKEHGINPQTMDLEKLKQKFQQMELQKSQILSTWEGAHSDISQMELQLENLEKYMGEQKEKEEPAKSKSSEKSRSSQEITDKK